MIYVFFLSQCYVKKGCNKYGNLCRNSNSALSAAGKTRLDRERAKMCQHEMVLDTEMNNKEINVTAKFINGFSVLGHLGSQGSKG